ncbi:MAG: STN domain-containing protein [Planctomycetaceae bacterium]
MRSCLVGLTLSMGGTRSFADDSALRHGKEFATALTQPVSAVRKEAELRGFLMRLAQVQHVACVVDRRVDPGSAVGVSLQQVPLLRGLRDLASQAGCEVGTLGSTLLIGRRDELDRILTPAALRQQELKTVTGITTTRRVELSRVRDIAWQDLDRPIDILASIQERWSLTLHGIEAVPHDRWYGGTAVDITAAEALSLVLGQFDLTFEWIDAGRGVQIIPAPQRCEIAQPHRTRAMSLAEATEKITSRFPQAKVEAAGTTLTVTATMLEQEDVAYLIGEKAPLPEHVASEATPLSRRRFPVTIVRTPLSKVLAALGEQQIDIHYDPSELEQAGISLEVPVSVKFENATAEEFFTAILTPAGLSFTIDGASITLRPAPQVPSP